jgi:hypothetical protein
LKDYVNTKLSAGSSKARQDESAISIVRAVEGTQMQRSLKLMTTMMLAIASFSVEAHNGLTWTKVRVDDLVGVVEVGCGSIPGAGNQCDPYSGDTPCSAELPVLCFRDSGFEQPALLPTPSMYHQWSGGIVATTDPVRGNSFNTIQDANQFCADNFGYGWRVAEFHEGWGWYFWAYGNVGRMFNDAYRRFWVDINDQPNGTCWSR